MQITKYHLWWNKNKKNDNRFNNKFIIERCFVILYWKWNGRTPPSLPWSDNANSQLDTNKYFAIALFILPYLTFFSYTHTYKGILQLYIFIRMCDCLKRIYVFFIYMPSMYILWSFVEASEGLTNGLLSCKFEGLRRNTALFFDKII